MANKGNQIRARGSQGFASMDQAKQRQIASKGGKSQGKSNNPGNFANDPVRAAEAGRQGGQSKRSDTNAALNK